MVARVLNLSGLYLGQESELFAGRPDNPEGFFEHIGLHEINDRVLEAFNASWDVPGSLPDTWESDPRLGPIYDDAKKLITSFDGHGAWGWKDPRNSLTLPFWKTLIPDLKVVVCLRNPIDVAGSLTKRGYASQRFGIDLWLSYMDAIEKDVSQQTSIVTHYESYFFDAKEEIKRVAEFCGLRPSEDQVAVASKTIKEDLRHGHAQLFDLIGAKTPLSTVVRYFLTCLKAGPVFENALRNDSTNLVELERRVQDTLKEKDAAIREAQLEFQAKENSLLAAIDRNMEAASQKLTVALAAKEIYVKDQLATKDAIWHGQLDRLRLEDDKQKGQLRTQIQELEVSLNNARTNAENLGKEIELMTSTKTWRLANRLAKVYRAIKGGKGDTPTPQPSVPVLEEPAPMLAPPEPTPVEPIKAEVKQEGPKAAPAPLVAQYQRAVSSMLEKGSARGPNFVPFDPSLEPPVDPAVKVIAFYLTQFHPIPENDKWWGKGFTEWTNVTKAVPQWEGQYQPHLPDELGFYDLRVNEVMERQVELARTYGLHGFAFYYYWFAGKRLLERPLDNFVKHPNIDFPFCVIWANENWTRRWDGKQEDVLMAQDHSPEGDVRLIEDLRNYIEHPNYIRIDGRPLIVVYRPSQLPDPRRTAGRWRDYCIKNGLGDPLIVAAQTFGFEDPRDLGFDASMQFPPHNQHSEIQFQIDYRLGRIRTLNDDYKGCICSYPALVGAKHNQTDRPNYPLYETAFPMWDNTPRLPLTGLNFAFSTPELYKIWLQKLCSRAIEFEPNRANRLVFVNAWNEWAEGAHLEPDRRYGFGYLRATREAVEFANRLEDGSATPSAIVLEPDVEMEEQLKDKPHAPIFVFQMGKVGSWSIYESLDKMNLPDPVLHLHLMNNIDRISTNVCKRYAHPEGTLFYLRRGQMVREWMKQAEDDTVWNVITGVREPVSQNVAAFFEMLPHMIPNIEERYVANDISVAELQELFIHQFDHKSPTVWFDDQLKPVFDVDVYATPFPHHQGYSIYQQGRSRVLLIRVEDLSRAVAPAMAEFLGLQNFSVQSRNKSEDKVYHGLAAQFKKMPLPSEFVDRMLSTPYAVHFYTAEEREEARKKWKRIS